MLKNENCAVYADKSNFNKTARQLKPDIIKGYKNETIGEYLCEFTVERNTKYSFCKGLIHTYGSWARSDDQKATRFVYHLENTFHPHDGEELSKQIKVNNDSLTTGYTQERCNRDKL